jgi:acetylornithine deacetylase/succinyl-diaminopimelate desuccinylase family protein
MSAVETAGAVTEREAMDLLREAVAVKSESELGIYEGAIVELYAGKMREIGMDVEIFEAVPNRPNVVGRLRGTGGGKSIFFNSHLMVPSSRLDDWKTDPYVPTVVDGKIYGMGVSDTKAGIVAILFAARDLARRRPKGDMIIGLGAGGEGGGFIGTKAIVERGVRADATVVCEPTELNIVYVQYGAIWFQLTVKGKAGLTGAGVNAIHKALPLAQAIVDFNETINQRQHPLLPPSRVSVNAIQGGDQPYNVPDRCMIRADRRIIPGETLAGAKAEMEGLLEDARGRDPELDVSSEILLELPAIEVNKDALVVREATAAITAVRGAAPELRGIRGFTEMAHVVPAGMDAIVCGPASTSVIHAPNEYVPVEEFMDCIEVYTTLSRRITELPR